MSEREEFEAWASSECVCDLRRNEFGDYRSQGVRQWWDGWQARAARTAQAELVAYLTSDRRMLVFADKVVELGHGMTPLYTAPDALQAEVERLKGDAEEALRASQLLWREVERLKHERHFMKERFHVAIKILRQCRYVPQAGLRGVVTDFLARINKEDAAKARTVKPKVKS